MAEQRSTLIIEISSEQALRNARALDRELQSIERTGNHATTSMNSMSVAARNLAVYMMGVVTVGGAIAKMNDWTNLNNRLRLVTDTQKELNIAMKSTFDIAQRSGSAWGGTAAIYQKIQYNSEKLGLSQTQVAKVTESISKSISNSGSSAQAASAALYQLGQSFDKSSLNGDEFVSMSENAGYLLDVFAKGLGVTRAELKEMSSQGLLTTDKMIEAIQKMSGSIENDFGKTNFTIGQSFTQLSNAVTEFVGEAGSGSGAAAGLSGAISILAENLEVVVNGLMISGAYLVGTYISALAMSTAAGYVKAKQLVDQTIIQYAAINSEKAAAATALAAAEAKVIHTQTTLAAISAEKALEIQRIKGQISDIGRIQSTTRMAGLRQVETQVTAELTIAETTLAAARTRSTAAAAAGMGVGRGLLGILTGPVGLDIAVAGVAAYYLILRDSTKDTTSTLDLQKGTVSELVAEYSKLDDLQKRTTMRELEKQVRDLSTAYTVSFSDLNAFIGWLEDSGSVSESTAKEVNALFKEYRKGSLSASDFATAINGLSGVQGNHKQKIDDLTTAQAKSKTEYEKVKTAQDALTKQTSSAVKANKDEAESIDAKRLAQEKLSALDKSYAQKNLDIDFSRINIKNHGLEMGKALAEFYDENKLSKTQKLSVEQWGIFQKNFSKQQELKNLENDITQSKKDQTKELEKQQKALQVNAKVQANASKYNFNGIEGKYGIPSGLLSGIHMQESRGNVNAVGPQTKYGTTKGGFQFLDSTAKRFKLFGNDVFDLGKSADAAGQYLQLLYKKFGDWDKAISAYHAGEGNVAAGNNIGSVNRQYVANVKGYIAGANGYSGSSKDFDLSMDDQAKYAQKTLEEIDQLNAKYSNADVIRNKDRLAEIAEAERLGQAQLIDQINLRYSDESYLAKLQLDQQVNGWKWVGEERINKEAEINRAATNASKEFSKDQKQLVMNGIDALSKYEIDEYRKTQKLKIAEYQMAFSQPLTELQAEVLDMQAKASMGGGYGTWALQNQYGRDLNSFGDDYDKNVNNINEDKTITDDATRKQLLLQAEESFRQSKLALNEKYTLLEQDLAKSQHQEQLQIWGSLLGQAQNTWSQITQAVKDSNGEQSASFKAAFLMQQAMAFALAIVSAHLAAVETTADTQRFTGQD
ncbi:tape measure protein [Acinetobacter sp. ULE_I010]|uniref:tape measure protein n=1 Tax=Acinetobacter sp. ULE_I010 TaxID=3373065 RepID=UPI003AF50BEB